MWKCLRFHNRLAEIRNRYNDRVQNFPLAFTIAMEIIIRVSKWVVGGERKNGTQLPPIRAYMEDLTLW